MTIATSVGATRGSNLVGGTLSAILKEYYEPGVNDLLNSKTILRRRLKRKTTQVEGKYFIVELNTGRNTGHGFIGAGGKLPDAKSQTYKQAKYSERFDYGRIKFDGVAASAARSDRGSFIRVMDSELNGLMRDMLHENNRIMFGDGSGRLAQISAVSGSTYTLRYPGGVVGTGAGTQYMKEGQTISVFASGSEAGTGPETAGGFRITAATTVGATVTSVDYSAATITVSSAHASAAAGDWIYSHGNLDDASASAAAALASGRGHEPNGLAAIVDDGDPAFQTGASGFWDQGLGAIPASTNAVWRATVIDNGGIAVPFSPDMFQRGMDAADINGDGLVSGWYTTHGIRRQYLNLLVAQKTFPNTMELDGGFKTLTWSERPVFVDKDCQAGRIYGLSEDDIYIAQEHDYQWMDADGNILRRLDDYDAFQATLMGKWQLATNARNRHVLITDIQDAA